MMMMNSAVLFTLLQLLFSLGLFLLSADTQKVSTALTVKEGLDDLNTEEDLNEDVLEVFHPTDQWQTLKPGQAVPAGCHIRLNLQTGQREAKLTEENSLKYVASEKREKHNKDPHMFLAQELKEALKKIKGEDIKQVEPSERPPFRSLDELKKDMAAVDVLVETDLQIIEKLLLQLNNSNNTAEQMVTALISLEYLVHQVDNAQNLVSLGGMQLLIDALTNSDAELQENAAFVLGSALSSNPSVQAAALRGGTLQTLLTLLATPRPLSVKKKVLFATACLLHHFPAAQRQFLQLGGLQVLRQLFREEGAESLRVRIITVLHDLINEEDLISQEDPVPDPVQLMPVLVAEGWCDLVPELLQSPEHDRREKALRTLKAMMPHCQRENLQNPTLSHSLHVLHKLYEELALTERRAGEEDGYFQEIFLMVDSLISQMHLAQNGTVLRFNYTQLFK